MRLTPRERLKIMHDMVEGIRKLTVLTQQLVQQAQQVQRALNGANAIIAVLEQYVATADQQILALTEERDRWKTAYGELYVELHARDTKEQVDQTHSAGESGSID